MATRRPDRAWIGGGVAACLVVAAAGWFFLISPQLDAKAESEQQFADAQTQNIVLQQRLNTLREQSTHLPEIQAELDAAQAAIPADHDVAGFTRQLTAQAAAAGVTVVSISPAAPVQLVTPQPEAPEPDTDAADAADTADSAGGSGSASTGETKAATAPSASGTIYTIAVTVITEGSLEGQRSFLSGLEKDGDRRSLVTATDLAPLATDEAADESGAEAADESGADEKGAEGKKAAPAAPAAHAWTMTTSLQIFVAPQESDDELASDTAQNSN